MLRELLGDAPRSEPTRQLTALYSLKLTIVILSRFKSKRLTTVEFPPFATIDEVARKTKHGGSSLTGYELLHGKTKANLPMSASLIEAGLVEYCTCTRRS